MGSEGTRIVGRSKKLPQTMGRYYHLPMH